MHHQFHRPERYDRHAGRTMRRYYGRIVDEVAAAGLAPGARVLDAGAGPGRVALMIARALPDVRVDGVDISPEMTGHATRAAAEAGLAGRLTFTRGDVAALPYSDDTFDLVVSSLSQHHWADPAAGLRDLRRVTRPGGRIWIFDVRFALRRAERAALASFPREAVRRERRSLLTGRLAVDAR